MTTAGGTRGGLAPRLLFAIALVLGTAAVTAWLVAGAIGPSVFRSHLDSAKVVDSGSAIDHSVIAFRTASAVALALALALGVLAAFAVSVLLSRRIGRSLDSLATAAQGIAQGASGVRVARPGIGREFDALAVAFNRMADRLEESERLRGRLLSDVAHELRTPVATIDASLEAIEDGVAELSPAMVAVLRAQGGRLVRLSEDLAAVTRAESGEASLRFERVDAAALVNAAVLAAADRARVAGVEVQSAAPEAPLAVVGDAERLAQVLGNLIDNAVRHSAEGGLVTVAAESRDQGRAVAITVADAGEGIAPEHLPHLFE
ncbi:ATP-binding protein, partial [Demequina sp.]|uniref:sensor histidine kinase n=1 Tax=Demequina sp. TaxID=2050685 RepID=UPI0025C4069F